MEIKNHPKPEIQGEPSSIQHHQYIFPVNGLLIG